MGYEGRIHNRLQIVSSPVVCDNCIGVSVEILSRDTKVGERRNLRETWSSAGGKLNNNESTCDFLLCVL